MKRFKNASEIKVGVIGYGGVRAIGSFHFREIKEAGMNLTAICDSDPARRAAAESEFPGIETYRTAKDMLAKSSINMVTLITPHNTHAPLAIECLKAGRHVVCEKPLGITTAECDAMIAAARQNSVMLSAYHNRHWDGCILNALQIIESGAIGEVVRVEAHMAEWAQPGDWWRSSKSISGGIQYDWGVHLLEYMLQIIKSEIVEVSGFAKRGYWADKTPWKADTNEDEAFAFVRFASGVWASLLVSSIDMNPRPNWLDVTGTEGVLSFSGVSYELTTRKDGVTVITKGGQPPSQRERYYKNIAAHLTKGEKLIITPEWARRPIHILDLACQSAKKGITLRAKY